MSKADQKAAYLEGAAQTIDRLERKARTRNVTERDRDRVLAMLRRVEAMDVPPEVAPNKAATVATLRHILEGITNVLILQSRGGSRWSH